MNTLFVKLLNIALGIISLATSRRYATLSSKACKSDCSSDVLSMEWSGFQVIVVCIIVISILFPIVSIFLNPTWRTSSIPHLREKIDCIFYFLVGLILLISGYMMIVTSIPTEMQYVHVPATTTVMPTNVENSISKDPEIQAKYNYGQIVTAGVIAMFNGTLYLYLGCYFHFTAIN